MVDESSLGSRDLFGRRGGGGAAAEAEAVVVEEKEGFRRWRWWERMAAEEEEGDCVVDWRGGLLFSHELVVLFSASIRTFHPPQEFWDLQLDVVLVIDTGNSGTISNMFG